MKLKFVYLIIATFVHTNLIGQIVESGKINIGKKIKIYSNVLSEEREIYIYEPKGFWGLDEEMDNLPVIYVMDGESQFQSTVSTIDYLSSAPNGNDMMPRSIVVGIPNTNRNRDLTPVKGMLGKDTSTIETTGGGRLFLDFITSELIPYIDSNYPTCNHRTIIGHSLGGLITFEALLNKREHFTNYVAIDPALGFGNKSYMHTILDTLRNADLSDENLFFAAANSRPTFMSIDKLKSDTSQIMQQIDKPNYEFLSLNDSKDWRINVDMKYYQDENHFSVPYRSTYDAMKFFYSFYPYKEMMDYYHPEFGNKKDLISMIEKHYQKISQKMGCEIIPMQGYINSFAFGMGDLGRPDLALELFNYNISLYHDKPTVYNSFGYYYMKIDDKKKAVQQFKKSLSMNNDEHILKIKNELQAEIESNKK